MYQDPDVAQVIRKLEKKKCDAVSSKYSIEMFCSEKYVTNVKSFLSHISHGVDAASPWIWD